MVTENENTPAARTVSQWDCLVMIEASPERDELVNELRRVEGYRIRKEGRDWVHMAFIGKEDSGIFPQEYMNLHDYLVIRGFVQGTTYWGSRRFEKPRQGSA
ncbi:hypothetical protein ACHAQJ_005467 [Trichoderma viride]